MQAILTRGFWDQETDLELPRGTVLEVMDASDGDWTVFEYDGREFGINRDHVVSRDDLRYRYTNSKGYAEPFDWDMFWELYNFTDDYVSDDAIEFAIEMYVKNNTKHIPNYGENTDDREEFFIPIGRFGITRDSKGLVLYENMAMWEWMRKNIPREDFYSHHAWCSLYGWRDSYRVRLFKGQKRKYVPHYIQDLYELFEADDRHSYFADDEKAWFVEEYEYLLELDATLWNRFPDNSEQVWADTDGLQKWLNDMHYPSNHDFSRKVSQMAHILFDYSKNTGQDLYPGETNRHLMDLWDEIDISEEILPEIKAYWFQIDNIFTVRIPALDKTWGWNSYGDSEWAVEFCRQWFGCYADKVTLSVDTQLSLL